MDKNTGFPGKLLEALKRSAKDLIDTLIRNAVLITCVLVALHLDLIGHEILAIIVPILVI